MGYVGVPQERLDGAWRLSRRDLRLITGMVMLGYLASHLANHALGLISLDIAETVLGKVAKFGATRL